jgi:glyoxylase-like metal-dependent hydrolase (beta-lactamase superfamily II)
MEIRTYTVGPVLTNCYVVWCDETKEGIIIDPGFIRQDEARPILKTIEKNSLLVRSIINTHGHPDHTCGNGILKRAIDAPILIHQLDAHLLSDEGKKRGLAFGIPVDSPIADANLKENEPVSFGKVKLRVLHTPGHSPGSISLVGSQAVFTGDTLFAGSMGRVDLPGGSLPEIRKSLQKLVALPSNLIVYPGHGPKSTIEREKNFNPFVMNSNLPI